MATATGFAMNAVCEPSMVSVVAPIRCAMNRSASGEIALSCSETRNQDGLLFQPAAFCAAQPPCDHHLQAVPVGREADGASGADVGGTTAGIELLIIAVPDNRDPGGLAVIHAMPTGLGKRED